jgi:hypothetical protein
MGVTIKDGVGVSVKSGAIMMANGVASYGNDGTPFISPAPPADLDSAPWSKWGNNNLLCAEMADHIENCGVLNAIEAKARISIGKGLAPYLVVDMKAGEEVLEYVNDAEINEWLEENNTFKNVLDLSYDKNAFGWNTGSIILNKKRDKINRVRRIDVVTARLEKMNKKGVIENTYLCNDWAQAAGSYNPEKMARLNCLKENYELEDLRKRVEAKRGFEFSFINMQRRNGRLYYTLPLWWAARAWVKVVRSIPAFKNAMFTNQIQLKYIITISEKYWPAAFEEWDNLEQKIKDEKVQEKYDEIEKWLTGEDKAYKTLIGGSFFDEVKGVEVPFIKVEVIDDKVKDGKLLPESYAGNTEILFALIMNPALMGAGHPGGIGGSNAGGSNVRESYLTQLMLMEAERRENANIYNVVKRFNGWDKKHEKEREVFATTSIENTVTLSKKKITPYLVWRYPSGVLTTLDTGKSTKNEAA